MGFGDSAGFFAASLGSALDASLEAGLGTASASLAGVLTALASGRPYLPEATVSALAEASAALRDAGRQAEAEALDASLRAFRETLSSVRVDWAKAFTDGWFLGFVDGFQGREPGPASSDRLVGRSDGIDASARGLGIPGLASAAAEEASEALSASMASAVDFLSFPNPAGHGGNPAETLAACSWAASSGNLPRTAAFLAGLAKGGKVPPETPDALALAATVLVGAGIPDAAAAVASLSKTPRWAARHAGHLAAARRGWGSPNPFAGLDGKAFEEGLAFAMSAGLDDPFPGFGKPSPWRSALSVLDGLGRPRASEDEFAALFEGRKEGDALCLISSDRFMVEAVVEGGSVVVAAKDGGRTLSRCEAATPAGLRKALERSLAALDEAVSPWSV